jgi:hypothetical protein
LAVWQVDSGDCTIEGDCVRSPNFPEMYTHGYAGACTITVTQDVIITATSFNTESSYDTLTLQGEEYDGTDGPADVLMTTGEAMVWEPDSSGGPWSGDKGFEICASVPAECAEAPFAPAHGTVGTCTPPVAAGASCTLTCTPPHVKTADFFCDNGAFTTPVCTLIEMADGDQCEYDDDGCVTSPNYPEQYGESEQCTHT